MITPTKAIKFAVELEDAIGLSSAHDKYIAKSREIIRDLAQQVEDLQAEIADLLEEAAKEIASLEAFIEAQ